ncbi:hypothetical protein KL86DES1_21139 [uncultured Desulfovibrio sp.]|uniref:Transposase n=1 Tax=uncultured Desulfovibrio sp. TaxID=167968 RepID=A0A212L6L7_9BACT|nr:hypothetical protein KL86DES1_21139 [uncultured Desulfovibrio sp.]VZH34036.1 conserved protein of unknown function [Desulfovibrio sp. 86]
MHLFYRLLGIEGLRLVKYVQNKKRLARAVNRTARYKQCKKGTNIVERRERETFHAKKTPRSAKKRTSRSFFRTSLSPIM